jgi:hypothetical protein
MAVVDVCDGGVVGSADRLPLVAALNHVDTTVDAARLEARATTLRLVTWYTGNMVPSEKHIVERVQTGVRMEKRLLKVLKAFADYHDLTLGDLLEGIVLHAFDGKCPFQPESLRRIKELKKFYGLDLDSSASHRMAEGGSARKKERSRK